MARIKKLLVTIEDIKKEVDRCIRMGYAKEQIPRMIIPRLDENGPSNEVLFQIVDDVAKANINYNFMQSISMSPLVRDIRGKFKSLYVVDINNRAVHDVDLNVVRTLFDKNYNLDARIRVCNFEYDPFTPKFLSNVNETIATFNCYNPPSWEREFFFSNGKSKIKKPAGMPEKYHRFLMHLVDNDEASYEYVLDWLANAIRGKNYTILATIGAQGIGKGVLGDIMSGIFQSNFTSTRGPDFFKGRFNAQILNKRMFYINEVEISSVAEEERLKLLIENTIEVEKKGIDAEVYPNYSSIYISTNNLDAIKLSGDDRRFSIVNLTSTKLLKIMTPEEIADLTSEDSVEVFARYLYHRDVDATKMLQVFKSKRTEEVRESALNEWQEFLLYDYGYDHAGKELTIRQVKEDIMGALDNVNYRIGRGALKALASRFPEKLKVFQRKDSKTGKPDHFIVLNPEGKNE